MTAQAKGADGVPEDRNSAVGEHAVRKSKNDAKRASGAASGRAAEPESHLAMVRRARRINRELAEVYPYAHPELDFR